MENWLVTGKSLEGDTAVLGVYDLQSLAKERKATVEEDNGRSEQYCCDVKIHRIKINHSQVVEL